MTNDRPLLSCRARRLLTGGLCVLFALAPLLPQLVHFDVSFAARSFIVLGLAALAARLGWNAIANVWSGFGPGLPALIGVAGAGISLTYAPELFRSAGEWSTLVSLLLLWSMLAALNPTRGEQAALAAAIVIGAALASLQALYSQWAGHEALIESLKENAFYDEVMREEMARSLEANRAMGRFGNPNHLAGYLCLSLWPLWLLWKRVSSAKTRLLLAAAGICIAIAVFQTYSRSGLIVTLATAAMFILFEWLNRGGRISWKPILSVFISLAAVGAIAALVVPAGLFGGRLMTISTIVARTHFYRGAIQIITDYPLFGVGFGGFEGYYAQYLRPGDLEARFVHNAILESAVEGGLVGLLLILWLCVSLMLWWRQRWRRSDDPALVWAAGGACFALSLLSLIDFHNRLIEMWYAPLLLIALAQAQPTAIAAAPAPAWTRRLAWTALLIFWIVFIGCRYGNRLANETGYYHLLEGNLGPARQSYEQAVIFDPSDAQSWSHLGKIWAQIPAPAASQRWLSCSERAVDWAPRRASLRADWAEALFALGYREDALEQVETAQRLFPARARYYELHAQFLRALNRPQEAEALEQTARRIRTLAEERKP